MSWVRVGPVASIPPGDHASAEVTGSFVDLPACVGVAASAVASPGGVDVELPVSVKHSEDVSRQILSTTPLAFGIAAGRTPVVAILPKPKPARPNPGQGSPVVVSKQLNSRPVAM